MKYSLRSAGTTFFLTINVSTKIDCALYIVIDAVSMIVVFVTDNVHKILKVNFLLFIDRIHGFQKQNL